MTLIVLNTQPHEKQKSMPNKFVPPRELLPDQQYNQLSLAARRLYAAIWNQLSWLGKAAVTRKDDDLASRARVSIRDLELARRELRMAGLLDIKCVNSIHPDGWLWEYRFPKDDA